MNTQLRIRCAHCGNSHPSVFEVAKCGGAVKGCMSIEPHGPHRNPVTNLWCGGYTAPAAVASSALPVNRGDIEPVTKRQLDYIKDLGGDMYKARSLSKNKASEYIDELKRKRYNQPTAQPDPWSAPNRQTTVIPMEFLTKIDSGYYAARQDSNFPYSFFRISRPKSGKFKDVLKIQTQHGPDYKLMMVVYPSGQVRVYNKVPEQDLLLVAVDPKGAAIQYAEEIGRCMRCNTELTDERSRWYGIGPECEKYWEWAIPQVEERKGPFPGIGRI